ncbi:MAG: ECF-type sigma factor, partial [Acidobacteriota bacterium]
MPGTQTSHDRDITGLLVAWRNGDSKAIDQVMPIVYEELRALARSFLRRERHDHTLEATAVTHEAYMKLVEKTHPHWEGRLHFFAVAAQAMRRVLIDHARERQATKRGGHVVKVSLEDNDPPATPLRVDVLDL